VRQSAVIWAEAAMWNGRATGQSSLSQRLARAGAKIDRLARVVELRSGVGGEAALR